MYLGWVNEIDSSKRFGSLHTNRSLTNPQWVTFLEIAKRKRMLPYMLGIKFWEHFISCVQSEVVFYLNWFI